MSMVAPIAREIGGYEVLAKLKAGGMATLYLGRRKGAAGFSRYVAIKFVHEHLAEDADFVRMFVNEALLQSRISHPNVVHVEELGETPEGQHFLVMEYVHGCSLSQLMSKLAKKSRALPLEVAVFVAMQIAAGLHAAHEARDEQGRSLGVVHRDVSPDNALLAYEGHVKLIDFGVAKVDTANKTSTGMLKGKLRFMSPEQASGREVDRRTDVYALAIVLWEMLTMRRLFAETDQLLLLDAVRNPVVPPPSSVRPDIPPALEAVVMKALSRDPSARYATAQELRRALAEAVPSALLVEASQLGALLTVAMATEIENERKRLPSAVASSLTAPPRPSDLPADLDDALATLTITIDGRALAEQRSHPSGGSQPAGGSQPSQPSASGARAIAPSSLPSSGPSPFTPPPSPMAAPLAAPPTHDTVAPFTASPSASGPMMLGASLDAYAQHDPAPSDGDVLVPLAEPVEPPRSRVGLWIAVASGVSLLGALVLAGALWAMSGPAAEVHTTPLPPIVPATSLASPPPTTTIAPPPTTTIAPPPTTTIAPPTTTTIAPPTTMGATTTPPATSTPPATPPPAATSTPPRTSTPPATSTPPRTSTSGTTPRTTQDRRPPATSETPMRHRPLTTQF
ncbi:MAG: serine/threonine-protein kinase [Sandaracinus sp.]